MTDGWDKAVYELLGRSSLTDIAYGLVPGVTIRRKFGRNSDIGPGTVPEDIWDGGGIYTGQPESATAELVTLSSSSANDTLLGSGARTVRLEGLGATLAELSEVMDTNGTGLVDSVNQYRRLPRIRVLTAGTGRSNAGILTVAHKVTTANVFARVQVGLNQTAICADTVPLGKVCLLLNWQLSAAKGGGGNAEASSIHLLVRELDGVYQAKDFLDVGAGAAPTNRPLFEILGPGSDWCAGVTSVSANATSVSASVMAIHIDENLL